MKKLLRHAWLLALLGVLPIGGCARPIIAWIVANFTPPKKVEAKFELPDDKRVLVLVENRTADGSFETVMRDLTKALNRELIKHDLADKTIAYEELMALRFSTPDYGRLAVTRIGQKLNAELVLYVHIDQFSLKDNAEDVLWQGRLEASVRVVQVTEGLTAEEARLWPKDRRAGYPVEPLKRPPVANSSRNYSARLVQHMAVEMADRIAKLFYDYRLDESQSTEQAWEAERILQ